MRLKAEIFTTRNLALRQRFRFRLIGDNNEPIAQSQGYTQKHNVTEVIAKYFPDAVVKDLTRY